MSLFGNLFSGVVKVALTPVAVLKDTVSVVTGEEPDATKSLIESAGDDIKEAVEDLTEGEII